MKNIESLLQNYGYCHHDSVACGGDFGTADKSGAAYDAVMEAIDSHHAGLQGELNAARALLREVVRLDDADEVAVTHTRAAFDGHVEKIRSYLDACDTQEGK